jgi:hypothetical protein
LDAIILNFHEALLGGQFEGEELTKREEGKTSHESFTRPISEADFALGLTVYKDIIIFPFLLNSLP